MKSSSPKVMLDGACQIPATKELTRCDIPFRDERNLGEVRTLVKVANRNIWCARMVQMGM